MTHLNSEFQPSEQLPRVKSGRSCEYVTYTVSGTNEATLTLHKWWLCQLFLVCSHSQSFLQYLAVHSTGCLRGWYPAMNPVPRSSRMRLCPYSGSQDWVLCKWQILQAAVALPASLLPAHWDVPCRNADMQKCRNALWEENNSVTFCPLDLIKVCLYTEKTSLIRPFLPPAISNPWERSVNFIHKIILESSPFHHLRRHPVGWILITITTYMGLYSSLLISCFCSCSSNLFQI